MKHTPGKWIDDGDDIGVEIIVAGEPVFTTICTIATPGLYLTSDTEMEEAANKALILAAPELLDLLKSAIARVELANAEGNNILSAWLPDARAAIARAGK